MIRWMPADFKTILSLDVPVIVEIGRRQVRLTDVMNWAAGAIIELPKGADDPLTICINNKAIGTGGAVKVGENFGIRLTKISSVADRVKALGE